MQVAPIDTTQDACIVKKSREIALDPQYVVHAGRALTSPRASSHDNETLSRVSVSRVYSGEASVTFLSLASCFTWRSLQTPRVPLNHCFMRVADTWIGQSKECQSSNNYIFKKNQMENIAGWAPNIVHAHRMLDPCLVAPWIRP